MYLASSNLKPLQIATQKGIYICASNVDDDSLRYSSAVISMMRPESPTQMADSARICHLRWQFQLTSNPFLW